MTDSILNSVKEQLGLGSAYAPFDAEIKTFINTALADVSQFGVGPETGYMIQAGTETWSDFMGTDKRFNHVQTYVFLKVKILFDPPATSHVLTAIEKQITEMGWRINAQREDLLAPIEPPVDDDPDEYGAGDYGEGPYGI